MHDRYRLGPLFLSGSILLAGACLALGSEPGSFDRSLPVAGPVYLDVKSDPGGVVITAGAAGTVRVHAVIKPLFGRLDLDIAEANIRALEKNPPIEQVGGRIRLGYVKDPSLLRAVSIRFEVETPRATEVHATTTSGGIQIDGITGPVVTATTSGRTEISNVAGEIRVSVQSGSVIVRNAGSSAFVRSQSGGLQLAGVQGAVDAETTSGGTEISDVAGSLRTATQSGNIRIENAKAAVVARNSSGSITALQAGGSVDAETRSGAIRISQLNPAPIRALAGSGSIQVQLASGGGYQLDALSHSGKISAPTAVASLVSKDGHSLRAPMGPGGPLVDLDTRSSRIEIR
ncbi:DUF4097 family beta strand repeat-containing protein [Paludibaculum fermentans]|uniref:DUF4097 family beta strand repeat protein n=1 Tax=Paludibaculum fermentans TaxID=1473598 RepID=A0A7S7NNI9_PALFE|nr:DUF4097 family beta strand repeat-containing protein [Paludibaculum fermentans]QOY86893.1 DUF4097 family beta strand repeat protein [Paludibaculum fermentans]